MATSTSTTVRKAFRVLSLFRDHSQLGVAECAALSGLPRPTAHRLLASLTASGALERTASHRYRLALQMFELGAQVPLMRALHDCAEPVMATLVGQTGLQAHLSVRKGPDVVYLLMLNRDAHRLQTSIGQPEPLHATAMGKVLLADAPGRVRSRLFGEPLPSYTPYTITSHEVLHEQLEAVQRTGFATSLEERRIGVVSLATGVHDREGRVLAAISIPGRAERWRHRLTGLERPLRQAADSIEAALDRLPTSRRTFDSDPMPG